MVGGFAESLFLRVFGLERKKEVSYEEDHIVGVKMGRREAVDLAISLF